jgi:cysteine-rich repeat protein
MRWLVVLALTGCLQPQLTPCGDDWCLEGSTCVADALCASADQIAACAGVSDGDTCAVGGGVGRCDRGVCVAVGCGNGKIDLGETCDGELGVDLVAGEQCSADCMRIEVCGNGVIDPREQCDDANTNPADGCDECAATQWSATALIGGNADATTVGLALPFGVAVDRRGTLYIAERNNHRVRRVDPTGVVTTVAGTGTPGFSGDGGPATSAQLRSPYGVAVDGLGTLYIADTVNDRIRRVDATTGVMTTVAGTGIKGFSGDGGAATSAQLAFPAGVAVDGLGNLYIADTDNHRIRRLDATTGVLTTVAGTGASWAITTLPCTDDNSAATSGELDCPFGVAVDSLGTLYIADTRNHSIRRVDATTGVHTTVAGTGTGGYSGDDGAAASAQLALPQGVAVDSLGTLYVADSSNHRIRRVDAATSLITTVAGRGPIMEGGPGGFSGDGGAATSAELYSPTGVAVDGLGTIHFADNQNHRIRRVDAMTGILTTVAGTGATESSGDGGAATSARIVGPASVAIDGLGAVLFADTNNHRIRRVDATTGVLTTVAGNGARGPAGDGGAATSAQLYLPWGVEVDGLGSVYIADTFNERIRRVDATTGILTTVTGTGTICPLTVPPNPCGDGGAATSAQLRNPHDVAVDGLGAFYIADTYNDRIRRVDPTTGILTTVAGIGTEGYNGDGGAATSAQLNFPTGIVIDGQGTVYIADSANDRIRRVDAVTGVITTVAGTGTSGFSGDGGAATSAQLDDPTGIAVDGLGTLYIADFNNHRIRRVDAMTGVITTVAGSATSGSSGDGGAATSAELRNPHGVAVDGLGTLYIAERGNSRVRRVDATTGVITTAAGAVDPEGMGPLAQARLADPRGLVVTAPFTLVAGGASGTVQAARTATSALVVVAGRYPQLIETGTLARFRTQVFGTVSGLAYDAASNLIYLTESSSNRLHVVTIGDINDENTWMIAPLANAAGTAGFADGPASTAQFRDPTGLYFDAAAGQLYVADTGNHVIRAIDLSSATVRTVAGIPATRGYFGDGGVATAALLYAPEAITRCANGDLFVADTGNHRVRRVAAGTNAISTVLGVGVAASSGEGAPASTFPVNAPLGLGCDAIGNLFVTSTTTVRLVPANSNGIVDGTGDVQTIYGAPPRDTFPASVTTCLTGLAVVDATAVQVVDSCTGLLVELRRAPK